MGDGLSLSWIHSNVTGRNAERADGTDVEQGGEGKGEREEGQVQQQQRARRRC